MRFGIISTNGLTFAVALVFAMLLTGCGLTDAKPWKETRRFYYTYVNTPVQLDLTKPDGLGELDSRLVTPLMSIDAELTSLERTLAALAGLPNAVALQALARDFPWLSSLVVLDAQAYVLNSHPPVSRKSLDYQVLLEVPEKTAARDLRYEVQDNPQGPELMVARPFLKGVDLQYLLVATFDMRALLTYVRGGTDLMALTPHVLLWSGDRLYSDTLLADVDWMKELKSHSSGVLKSGKGNAVWLVRYLGYIPIVFVLAE